MIRWLWTIIAGWLTTVQVTLAQFNIPEGHYDPAKGTDPNVDAFLRGESQLGQLISQIVALINAVGKWIMVIGAFIWVLMLVVGGIQYITNQPDAGKKTITAAIVGGFIVGLASAIIYLAISLIK